MNSNFWLLLLTVGIGTFLLMNTDEKQPLTKVEKANEQWLAMTIEEWIQHPNHPCPVICVKYKKEEDEYHRINQTESFLSLQNKIDNFYVNLSTKAFGIIRPSNIPWTKWRKDLTISIVNVSKQSCINFNDFKQLCILDIIASNKLIDCFLCFKQYQQPTINLIVRRMNSFNSGKTESKKVGTKINLELLLNFDIYHNVMNEYLKTFSQQFTFYICKLLLTQGYVLGDTAYYMAYDAQYYVYQYENIFKKYIYLNYTPTKKIKSIVKYYETYNEKEILKQQNDSSPPDVSIKYIGSVYSPHQFWTGLSLQPDIVTVEQKWALYQNIFNWATKESWGHKELNKARNRYKLSYGFYYLFNENDQKNKNDIAHGLRLIGNKFTPQWFTDFVAHTKNINFIPYVVVINQATFVVYFNDTDKIMYNVGTKCHFEGKKFGKVYSVSLYSSNWIGMSYSYLSLGLIRNLCNGELKIPLIDRCGLEMKGNSWCLNTEDNIVNHSISPVDQPLPPGWWRITCVLRNVCQPNVDAALKYHLENL
eukprot:67693_1